MTARPNLRVIADEPTVEDELKALLNARQRIDRERAQNDAAMRPLMRRFADERGEKLLPTVERLKRELL